MQYALILIILILLPNGNNRAQSPFRTTMLKQQFMIDGLTHFSVQWARHDALMEVTDRFQFYYSMTIDHQVRFGKLFLRNTVFNELGLIMIPDSNWYTRQDNLQYKQNLCMDLYSSSWSLGISRLVKTQCWNKYMMLQKPGQSEAEKAWHSAYMSPGYITWSVNLNYTYWNGSSNLQFNLGSGKITRFREQSIFNSRGLETIAGVTKGQERQIDWGLGLSHFVPVNKIWRKLSIENITELFINHRSLLQPRTYTFDCQTGIHYPMFNILRISYRNKLMYDPQIGSRLRQHHQIILGIFMNQQH